MANQPQDTPKGQIPSNTGATPPKRVITKITKAVDPGASAQNMKRIAHNAKLEKHNGGLKGQ